jgi:hypothetical protein
MSEESKSAKPHIYVTLLPECMERLKKTPEVIEVSNAIVHLEWKDDRAGVIGSGRGAFVREN